MTVWGRNNREKSWPLPDALTNQHTPFMMPRGADPWEEAVRCQSVAMSDMYISILGKDGTSHDDS